MPTENHQQARADPEGADQQITDQNGMTDSQFEHLSSTGVVYIVFAERLGRKDFYVQIQKNIGAPRQYLQLIYPLLRMVKKMQEKVYFKPQIVQCFSI